MNRILSTRLFVALATAILLAAPAAGEMDWIRNHKPEYRSFVFRIKRLDIFDEKTAVIAGTGVVRGAPGPDGPMDFTYESSNVLIKRDGRWQAVLSHVSGIRPE